MHLRSLATNYGLLVIGEGIAKSFTFVAFVFLARKFGASAYGDLEFALNTIFILSLVIDFGFGVHGAKVIAKEPHRVNAITHLVVSNRFWFTLLCLIILVIFATIAPLSSHDTTLLLLFAISLIPTPFLLQWVFQARDWMNYVSITQVLRHTIFSLIILTCVREPSDFWCVPIAEIAGVGIAAIYCAAIYKRRFSSYPRFLPDWPNYHLILESLPIAMSQFMWAIRYVFVIVILRLIAPPEEVGQFGVVLRVIVSLHMFISLYFYNLMPSASRSTQEPLDSVRSLLTGGIRATTWVSLPLSMVTILVSPWFVNRVYGSQYAAATPMFQILVWMLATSLLSSHFRVTLIAYDRQKIEMITATITAIVNLALIFILYQLFGLTGVAAAMLLSELLTLVLSYCFVDQYVASIRIWDPLKGPTVAALVAIIAMAALWSQSQSIRLLTVVLSMGTTFAVMERKFLASLVSNLRRSQCSNPEVMR